MHLPNLANLTTDKKININRKAILVVTVIFTIFNLFTKSYPSAIATAITGTLVILIGRFVLNNASFVVQASFLSTGQFLIILITGIIGGNVGDLFSFFLCSLVMSVLYFNLTAILVQCGAINLAVIVCSVFFYTQTIGNYEVSYVVKNLMVTNISVLLLALCVKYSNDILDYASSQHAEAVDSLEENKVVLEKSNALMEEQKNIIDNITNCSANIASSTERINAVTQNLENGVSEQENAIHSLTSAINDITTRVNDVTNAANRGQTISNETSQIVNVGKDNMHDMLNAMQDLKAVSAQINKVVAEIENIAFQTNILALNAAVEAARAGAAGKGFSVVAEEVGNLASKSAQSAKNTSNLMTKITENIDHGISITNHAVDTFNSVVEAESNTQSIMQEIHELSSLQVNALNELQNSSTVIDHVIHDNKEVINECASLANELLVNSESLQTLTNK